MRNWLLGLSLLVAPIAQLHGAGEDADLTPRCGGPFQLCGYVEKSSEAPRIPQRFEVAQPFKDGLAAVRIDGLYGYVDSTGQIIIAPRFQAAGQFTAGYAEVRLNGASGIIDRAGRQILPPRFDRIIPLHGGVFIAAPLRDDRPQSGGPVARLDGFDLLGSFSGWRGAGLYHRHRGWLTGQDLQFSFFDIPERGLVWAARRDHQGEDAWGLLKFDGTWQVSPRYSHVQSLNETHAVVRSMPDRALPPRERHDAILSGAVDRDGKLVVPLKFAYLSYWRGGYGYAFDRKPNYGDGSPDEPKEGIVRADGSLLGGRYFDKVDIREDGKLPRGRIGRVWYSIELGGRLVSDQLDGRLLVECQSGLKVVEHGEEVEFLRPADGRPVGRFDNGFFGRRECPGPFSAQRDGNWYIVLEDGTVLGGEKGFESSYGFNGDHAAVRVDGRWGIIDRSGTFTVRPRFPELRPDRNGAFVVGEGPAQYWIDSAGKRIDRPAAERADPARALTCPGGLRFFQRDGLWGFQDGNGRTVIEPRFRALSCFEQGVSWTASPGASRWCPIGPDGQRREAMPCSETYYPVIVTEHSPEEFSPTPYESSVLWNRAWLDYQAGAREEPPKWISRFGPPAAYTVMPGGPSGNIEGLSAHVLNASPFHNPVRLLLSTLVGILTLMSVALWARQATLR